MGGRMNKEDIIRMAREAGMAGMLTDVVTTFDELERFAALVAAAAQKDAARYQHIKGMARAMSLDMDGNHYWHMGLRDIRGPNLDEAIDRAIKAEGQA
jgi:hypothetical protein